MASGVGLAVPPMVWSFGRSAMRVMRSGGVSGVEVLLARAMVMARMGISVTGILKGMILIMVWGV